MRELYNLTIKKEDDPADEPYAMEDFIIGHMVVLGWRS